ncbi:MAG: RagB/SusD family nutrient uptake outer membrane protein [Cyclobacteriaceae bacterium]|nr:RagB/SusD family nutrient uptake outer membrane protein [Cyclobacteriaceae bacterium]
MRFKSITLIVTITLLFTSCLDLDIPNPNDPTTETVLSDPGNLTSITSGILNGVFGPYSPSSFYAVNSSLEWTADHTTMTNNVLSWWAIFKTEPRQQLTNTISWPNKASMLEPWNQWNGTVVNANTVIRTLEENESLTEQLTGLLAVNYFARGMALGYIGNVFDKGYIVPLSGDPNYEPALVPYANVVQEALSNLERAIELFEEVPDFVLPNELLNGLGYTSGEMAALCHTYYAHILVSSARNATQNAATDWAKVKQHAQAGIARDFTINADGSNILHAFQYGSGIFWYFRVDHRVMRHFNSNLPKRFPDNATAPTSPYTEAFLKGTGYNGDKRLDAYFLFEPDLSFYNPARDAGRLRSHYRIRRYDALYNAQGIGASVFMYRYANQLLLAEAEAMTNNLTAAVTILNDPANPRKAVGEMPTLANTLTRQEVLDLIFAERDIELGRTDFGLPFFDMRRKNALQRGTVLHLPVPADELVTQGFTVYTFGGVDAADGENTADGSNSWLN